MDQHDSNMVKHKAVIIVTSNSKYIFKSQNPRTKIKTWRCSFKPSCKATINVNRAGKVLGGNPTHNHPALPSAQVNRQFADEVLIYKNVEDEVHLTERLDSDSESKNHAQIRGSRSARKVEKNISGDSSQTETGSEDESFVGQVPMLPRLGPAFSVAGRKDMVMMGCRITRENEEEPQPPAPAERGIPTNDESSSGKFMGGKLDKRYITATDRHENQACNPSGHNGFSVPKGTGVMRNILAGAIEALNKEYSKESSNGYNEPSKQSRGQLPEKVVATENGTLDEIKMEVKMEEEWQWEFIEQKIKKEKDDEEEKIDVEISDEEDKDAVNFVGEDEMAMILGE